MSFLIENACMPQVRARSAGQAIAPEQVLNMTNAKRLEEYRNATMAASSLAAAQTTTHAASVQLDLRILGEGAARASREYRLQMMRLKRQHPASQAAAPAGPPPPQPETLSGKRKRGGVGVSKKCGACGLHKTRETGHTNTTCPTHCLKCKTAWQDPEQMRGCSCQL